MAEWALQDAKNRFSAVVDAALAATPQRVTRRGKPAVVVLAMREFERLCRLQKSEAPSFGELLAAIPRGDVDIERIPLSARALAFFVHIRYYF